MTIIAPMNKTFSYIELLHRNKIGILVLNYVHSAKLFHIFKKTSNAYGENSRFHTRMPTPLIYMDFEIRI